MEQCHVCRQPIPEHSHECRVFNSLEMFERVFRRLAAESRAPDLQANLIRQLRRHGRQIA
jgi:hypothetical protein